ncbi:hypothetical protein AAFN64_17595, partial [Flavobacterium sp. CAU 1735]
GNSLNYTFRMHDSRTGRFFARDPLERDYTWNSPYAFSENRVIDALELEGLEKVIYTFTKNNGKWSRAKLDIANAGPLGDGVLVKFKNDNTEAYYYGPIMNNWTGKDFTKSYEDKFLNKKGDHYAYKVKKETFTTIGYGHANKSKEDAAKYPLGSTITETEASALFDKDYLVRAVSLPTVHQSDALSDFSFNTTNLAEKTVNRYNSSENKQFFYVDNIRNKSPEHTIGLAKRRSAQQILATYKQYTKIDYSKSAQPKWKKTYEEYTNKKNEKKKEKLKL